MQKIVRGKLALAYHDRSDGGIVTTLAEMAMTGGRGIEVALPDGDILEQLFTEQPGAVLQVAGSKVGEVLDIFKKAGIKAMAIGECDDYFKSFVVNVGARCAIHTDLTFLRRNWSETTYRMQAHRDNPKCALEEYDNSLDQTDPGLKFFVTYDPDADGTPLTEPLGLHEHWNADHEYTAIDLVYKKL